MTLMSLVQSSVGHHQQKSLKHVWYYIVHSMYAMPGALLKAGQCSLSRVANWCGTKRFSWCGKRIAAALSCSQSIRTHPESADFGPTARSQDHHRSYVLYPHGSRSRPKPSPRRPIYTSGVKRHYPVYTYNSSHSPKLHWQECHV